MFKIPGIQKSILFMFSVSLLGLSLTACTTQDQVYKYIDKYMAEKGPDVVEKALNEIIKRRQQKGHPSLEQRLKNRVDVSIEGAPVEGAKNAPITIVEFSDFQCPFCKRVLPTIDKIMKDYKSKVRLAYRFNPLPFHKDAKPSANAAMAAQAQGKFWAYHDILFNNQQALTQKNFIKWAKQLKMNVAKFKKDMKNPANLKRIETDQGFARKNGAGGTPSFFINGVRLVGAQPYANFKEIIDALLKEKS